MLEPTLPLSLHTPQQPKEVHTLTYTRVNSVDPGTPITVGQVGSVLNLSIFTERTSRNSQVVLDGNFIHFKKSGLFTHTILIKGVSQLVQGIILLEVTNNELSIDNTSFVTYNITPNDNMQTMLTFAYNHNLGDKVQLKTTGGAITGPTPGANFTAMITALKWTIAEN